MCFLSNDDILALSFHLAHSQYPNLDYRKIYLSLPRFCQEKIRLFTATFFQCRSNARRVTCDCQLIL